MGIYIYQKLVYIIVRVAKKATKIFVLATVDKLWVNCVRKMSVFSYSITIICCKTGRFNANRQISQILGQFTWCNCLNLMQSSYIRVN